MSRIGKQPINIPAGVTVSVANTTVTVKGPKGTLTQEINPNISVAVEGNVCTVTRPDDEKLNRSMHGLYRSLIQNMVTGVTTGFTKSLEIVGVGYRAEANPLALTLNVGYSNPVVMQIPEGLTVEVEKNTLVHVRGIDKQQVGELAARIRRVRKPEPYRGKGIRYVGEQVRRKVGKAGSK